MLIKIHPVTPNAREVAQTVKMLREGAIIIYPTDTVYAIGCDALNVRAVEEICRIKGIDPKKNNLSIICSDFSDLSEYVKISDEAFKLMKHNLPGPFTFILPASSNLPKLYRSRKEIGIRIPDNNITKAIVSELGNPLLSMSLYDDHGTKGEYEIYPDMIYEKYGNLADVVIDGGEGGTIPSTVVDCTGSYFEILREGKGTLIE